MRAGLFISHGSRSPASRKENVAMANLLAERGGLAFVENAFLEVEPPDIPSGIRACVRRGASEIVIFLNFLNSGRHVLTDIPGILDAARAEHPAVRLIVSKPLGAHPRLAELFLELANEAGA